MARKLRLEKGDFVTLKLTYGPGFAIGRVYEVYKNPKEDWNRYGIYAYTIHWSGSEIPSKSGWTITDITAGRLKYLKDRKAIEILYGRKEV